jgi:hypothetical protein
MCMNTNTYRKIHVYTLYFMNCEKLGQEKLVLRHTK